KHDHPQVLDLEVLLELEQLDLPGPQGVLGVELAGRLLMRVFEIHDDQPVTGWPTRTSSVADDRSMPSETSLSRRRTVNGCDIGSWASPTQNPCSRLPWRTSSG